MLILEMGDTGYGFEVLPDNLSKHACTGTVQYAHPRTAHLYGIVDKIGDSLQSLVGTHASYIDFLFEV